MQSLLPATGKVVGGKIRGGIAFILVLLAFVTSRTPSAEEAKHGTVERIKVHGKSLEGNLQ